MKRKLVAAGLAGAIAVVACARVVSAQRAEQERLEATIAELRASLRELSAAPRDRVRVVEKTTRVVDRAADRPCVAPPPQPAPQDPREWERETVARLEQRLAADTPDAGWSQRQESRISETLRAAGEANPFSEIRCRGSMCRLAAHLPSADAYHRVFQLLFGPQGVEHAGVSAFPSYGADGSIDATLYLARTGTTYAFAP